MHQGTVCVRVPANVVACCVGACIRAGGAMAQGCGPYAARVGRVARVRPRPCYLTWVRLDLYHSPYVLYGLNI